MTKISSFGGNSIVDRIRADSDYFEDMLIRSVHHSASIEGNTITLEETRVLLIDRAVPNFSRRVSPRELYELDNLRNAWEFMLDVCDEKITVSIMHDLHRIVMDRSTDGVIGTFKRTQNMVGGNLTTNPENVQQEIIYLLDNLYNGRLIYASSDKERLEAVAEFHFKYEHIHPYEDGNGRTGRCLMSIVLMYLGFPPVVVEVQDKAKYMTWIKTYDVGAFSDYINISIKKELELLNRNAPK